MIVTSDEEISYEEWKRRCSLNDDNETSKSAVSSIFLPKTKTPDDSRSQKSSNGKVMNFDTDQATNDDDSLKQISASSSDQESNSSFYSDVFSSIDFELEGVLEENMKEKENKVEEIPDSPSTYESFWDAVEEQEKILSQENIFTSSFENLIEKENSSKRINPVSEKYKATAEKANNELEFDESELEKYYPKEQDLNELCNSPDFKLFNTLIQMNYYSEYSQLDPIREESYSELEEYENDTQIRRLSKNKFASAKNNLNKIFSHE
ncbi:UNVERIFIED_CONTAM: hypothetical protein RMT77_005194 [Armadillidium vulgare]